MYIGDLKNLLSAPHRSQLARELFAKAQARESRVVRANARVRLLELMAWPGSMAIGAAIGTLVFRTDSIPTSVSAGAALFGGYPNFIFYLLTENARDRRRAMDDRARIRLDIMRELGPLPDAAGEKTPCPDDVARLSAAK